MSNGTVGYHVAQVDNDLLQKTVDHVNRGILKVLSDQNDEICKLLEKELEELSDQAEATVVTMNHAPWEDPPEPPQGA